MNPLRVAHHPSLTRLLHLPESLIGANRELLKGSTVGQTTHQQLVEDVAEDTTEQAAHCAVISNLLLLLLFDYCMRVRYTV